MRLYQLIEDSRSMDSPPEKNYVLAKERIPLERVVDFWLDYDTRITGFKHQEWNIQEVRQNPPAHVEKGNKLEGGEGEYRDRYIYDLGDITEQELTALEKFEIPIIKMTDRY